MCDSIYVKFKSRQERTRSIVTVVAGGRVMVVDGKLYGEYFLGNKPFYTLMKLTWVYISEN